MAELREMFLTRRASGISRGAARPRTQQPKPARHDKSDQLNDKKPAAQPHRRFPAAIDAPIDETGNDHQRQSERDPAASDAPDNMEQAFPFPESE